MLIIYYDPTVRLHLDNIDGIVTLLIKWVNVINEKQHINYLLYAFLVYLYIKYILNMYMQIYTAT